MITEIITTIEMLKAYINPWIFEGFMFMVGFTAGYFMFKQNLTIEKPGEEGKNERIMNGYVKIFAWTAAILGIFSVIISGSAIAGLATVLTLALGYFVGIIIYGMIHTHMTV